GDDDLVSVDEGHPERFSDALAHLRLAGTHGADQDGEGPRHAEVMSVRSASGIAARYASRLRFVSPTESPPNFSSTELASTRATIASATTPAAGTAHTSDRWWCACAASPVATSIVR